MYNLTTSTFTFFSFVLRFISLFSFFLLYLLKHPFSNYFWRMTDSRFIEIGEYCHYTYWKIVHADDIYYRRLDYSSRIWIIKLIVTQTLCRFSIESMILSLNTSWRSRWSFCLYSWNLEIDVDYQDAFACTNLMKYPGLL